MYRSIMMISLSPSDNIFSDNIEENNDHKLMGIAHITVILGRLWHIIKMAIPIITS